MNLKRGSTLITFTTKEPQFVYQTNCGSLCILGLNELILFRNMNKTGTGMVSDTNPAPVFCHFRVKNPHYFWLFFASAKRDQKDRVTVFECIL